MTTVPQWRRTLSGQGRLATAALLGLGVALVAAVDPHTSGRYPTCPFHAVTGLWCPGCGGLRAVHDLTHGSSPLRCTRTFSSCCWGRRSSCGG